MATKRAASASSTTRPTGTGATRAAGASAGGVPGPGATDPAARSPRSPLEHGLDRVLAAYARHMLTGARAVPPLTARIDGAEVSVAVQAPDGAQAVRRRPSAFLGLCGDVWGSAQAPGKRALMPSLIASFTAYPDGGRNRWDRFYDLETDLDWIEGLEAVAAALVESGSPGAREEATLILRRLYEVDDRDDGDTSLSDRSFRPRTAPAAIARAVAAPSAVAAASRSTSGSTTPIAMVKRVAPFAGSPRAADRLAAATGIGDALPWLSQSNHLTFLAVVDGALPALLAEGDGAVHELALGVAQNLGMKLLLRGAYAEARRLLDPVIERHGALAESLRARWECRLYLDALADGAAADAGEQDWTRAALLDSPTDASPLGRGMFWSGDVDDRRRVALARVARGLVARAGGGDACPDRKVAKRAAPTADERARLLARAATLSGAAVQQGAGRVERDLERARAEGAARERGFSAEEYAARAKVEEASGDLPAALRDYEAARELRVAGGLAWQIDHFGPDIRRVRRRLDPGATAAAVPASFEPAWLLSPERTSAERAAAVAAWSAEPWRTFPATPAAAAGRPFAYVLLRDVLAASSSLWKLARADGIALGDRVAFGGRALALLDPWFDLRVASRLEDVLDDAPEVAFLGAPTSLEARTAAERRPLLDWVAGLAAADPLDEAAVLRGLAGAPWERLGECFAAHVDAYDRLRDLLDALVAAGVDADAIAVVLRAYVDLLGNDWSSHPLPQGSSSGWAAHGEALARLDAARVAPALIAWTRARQQVPAEGARPRLDAKWLWPLHYAWSEPHCPALLADVKRGLLDGKPLTRPQKAIRQACLAWFDERPPAR